MTFVPTLDYKCPMCHGQAVKTGDDLMKLQCIGEPMIGSGCGWFRSLPYDPPVKLPRL